MELPDRKPSAQELLPCHPFPSDPWPVLNGPVADRPEWYPRMGTHIFVCETDHDCVRSVHLRCHAPFHIEGFTEFLGPYSDVKVEPALAEFERHIEAHTLPEMIEDQRHLRACRPIAECTHMLRCLITILDNRTLGIKCTRTRALFRSFNRLDHCMRTMECQRTM